MKNIRYKQRLTKEKRVSPPTGRARTVPVTIVTFQEGATRRAKKKPAPPHAEGQEKLGK